MPAATAYGFFEEILNSGSCLRIRVTGRSMAPFLRGGEIVTIRKTQSHELRRGDLIFFRSADGGLVLHRVMRKKRSEDGLIFHTKGDALLSCDVPVKDGEVFGKVCHIEREGPAARRIDMESTFQKKINALTASVHILKAETYRFLSVVAGLARAIL